VKGALRIAVVAWGLAFMAQGRAAATDHGGKVENAETSYSWRVERSQAGDAALVLADGRKLTLRASDYRAATRELALRHAADTHAPIYLTFDGAGVVDALVVAQRRVVMGLRPEPGSPLDAVTFQRAPSVYFLKHDLEDYHRIHALLERSAARGEEVWVATAPGGTNIADVRPAP
jgi:hypothetical protein